jgi:hypothetical protein
VISVDRADLYGGDRSKSETQFNHFMSVVAQKLVLRTFSNLVYAVKSADNSLAVCKNRSTAGVGLSRQIRAIETIGLDSCNGL